MKNEKSRLGAIRTFWEEVVAETKKSTWPERQELIESTVVVIVAMILLSSFVGLSDKLLLALIKFLISLG